MKKFHFHLLVNVTAWMCVGFGCSGSAPARTESATGAATQPASAVAEEPTPERPGAPQTDSDDTAIDTRTDTEPVSTAPSTDEAVVSEDTDPQPPAATSAAEETEAATDATAETPGKETTTEPTTKSRQTTKPKQATKPKKAAIAPPPKGVFPGHTSYTFIAKNGNVAFGHSAHKSVTTCKTCHHDKEQGTAPPACRSCHGKGKGPSFKDAAHQLCKNCHQKKGMDTSCKSCHQ